VFVLIDQQAVLRQYHHHAGAFDLVDLRDGASEFALQRADIVGTLDEVRNAEVRLVEDFEADAVPVSGDAFARELHPHKVDLLGGHQDGAPAGANLVGHFGVVQRGDDLGGLGVGEFTVEQAVIGATRPPGNCQDGGSQHPGGQGNADALAGAKLFPDFLELVPDPGCVGIHSEAIKPACA